MSKLIKGIAAFATALAFAAPASAEIIQTSSVGSYHGYQAWGHHQITGVTLAQGTNEITGLTSSARIWDQGWGGEWAGGNHVFMGLYYGGDLLWSRFVAGAYHQQTVQTFDIRNDTVSFANLNAALDQVDWAAGKEMRMQMMASPIGWGGWELHVDNASFSVSSDTIEVPEPASLALLGLGVLGFAASRRRAAQR
jgi:hypothetical protein